MSRVSASPVRKNESKSKTMRGKYLIRKYLVRPSVDLIMIKDRFF